MEFHKATASPCSAFPPRAPSFFNCNSKSVQDSQVPESLEGTFGNVADGIVAKPQDTQAAQLGQALFIQTCKVVERQNPKEGAGGKMLLLGLGFAFPSLKQQGHNWPELGGKRTYTCTHRNPEGKSGRVAQNPQGANICII